MGSNWVLNLNYSPVVHLGILSPPAVYLPAVRNATSSTWLKYRNKLISLKITERRVSTQDVSPVSNKDDSTAQASETLKKFEDSITYIKTMLNSIGDGRISVSPYDTAWVALIKDLQGRNIPQFQSSLDWIAQHQLPDGSWGDQHFFSAYDRLVNTLACIVALRSWNIHADKIEKGISYIKRNVCKLEDASVEHMTCGFEIVFTALLQRARSLGIDGIPYDAPVVREVYNMRDQKIKRIPMELMHKVPTSLLFSLEGLENLDWEKLLKLQSTDGSFLTSPSSTAFAFMVTKDENCQKFITNVVEKFNGGAPHTYPVDIFARLWAIDRLQRLGISRFFESEIADCLSHIYRYWTPEGVFSGRESKFCDIDDTSMGFRLLRLHGYDVDPNVLRNFKKDNKFSCYGGQMIESPSPIYNLYRASQVRFPGEEILEEASDFAYKFLQEKLASNEVLDKWVISKHLPDEIRIGLKMSWYGTLPRVETRYYLQHYGGGEDVWIGKTLYRMAEISNDAYLELARLDFNRCQEQHQIEWLYMQGWYESCKVEQFGISRKDLLLAFFLATASIFEPKRTQERVAWAKSQIISRMITSFYNKETTSLEQKNALLKGIFPSKINGLNRTKRESSAKRERELVDILLATQHQLLEGFDRYINHQLKEAWGAWLMKLHQGEADNGAAAELVVTTLNICGGHIAFKEDILSHHEYKALSHLTNKICHQLSDQIQNKKAQINDWNAMESSTKDMEIDHEMQVLVKLVLHEEPTIGIDRKIKQTFLAVAKAFYYSAFTSPEVIDSHIFKVLFEPV